MFPNLCSRYLVICLLGLGAGIFLTACGEEPPLRLTSRERVQVDTLYTKKIEVLKPQWDSLCEATYDSLLEVAVDSIIKVRKEEEFRLRERLKRQGEQ